MPMPVMKVDAYVFTEVPESMFFFQVRGSVVSAEKEQRILITRLTIGN